MSTGAPPPRVGTGIRAGGYPLSLALGGGGSLMAPGRRKLESFGSQSHPPSLGSADDAECSTATPIFSAQPRSMSSPCHST